MKGFLEKLKAARRDPRAFLPTAIAEVSRGEEWNVPLIGEFGRLISDPAQCSFDPFFLDAILSILKQLDTEPWTSSRIVYYRNNQRQPLLFFDSKKPLFGIPLWLHSLGVAAEIIDISKEERPCSAAKKITGSTLAVEIITALAHDLGKQNAILNLKIKMFNLAASGRVEIGKRQHALYSSQAFSHLMTQKDRLVTQQQKEIIGRIEIAIFAHHEPVETLPRIVQIRETGALDLAETLQEADGKSRAKESERPRLLRPEVLKKTSKKR